jgi:bifunctional ADP-heptose synthase (sugar kinase/adenylyltransferase)
VIITRGRFGAQLYKNNKIVESPAFNLNTLDAMGAGDTFLSLIAICLKSKMDIDLSMLIASLGASHSTQKIGHSDILTLDHIERSLNYLFK